MRASRFAPIEIWFGTVKQFIWSYDPEGDAPSNFNHSVANLGLSLPISLLHKRHSPTLLTKFHGKN
jgi:hypothetical protein